MTSTIAESNQPHPHTKHPVVFDEFFDMGLDESASPFLTPGSRKWSENLTLKTSILSAVLLILSFTLSLFPSTVPLSNLALIAVYVTVGIPPLIESIEDIISLEINIDVLMTIAAFSSVLIGSGMEGALLLVLFAISHAMEHAVAAKAKSAINSLTKLSPTTASVIESDGTLIERSVKDIPPGTKILVKAGSIVPLDGKVVEGTSSLNLVHLTGENLPVTKVPGDQIPSGGQNLEGALTIEVTHTSADSTLSKIIKLVTQAQEARPRLQRWFDKLSNTYASTIIFLAVTFALLMPYFLGIPFLSHEGSVYRALAFLIAASPCALIIAIPIAYLSAISVCAKNGILLKGGLTLDALASCNVFAFDKTGTLTTGKLQCLAIETLSPDEDSLKETALSVAYALERNAVHPIAEGIINYAKEQKAKLAKIDNFKSIPGYGLEATTLINNEEVSCSIGHVEFITEKLSDDHAAKIIKHTDSIKKQGDLVAVMLMGANVFIFHFEDTPRTLIKETLAEMKRIGKKRLLMLTGDHEESAKKIAREMNIDEYYANLRPEDKLQYVGKIAQKEGLAMIGDGINDAPALARATVGICMGQVGSTAAVDAADVILLQDNIEQLNWLAGKSLQTQTIVKQNLAIATGAILIASIPALAGIVPLWLAVILHEGGTVLVGLNALRLLSK
ncbi:MAG: cation-translocating P-type ATPase [Chlamydiota bacterium]|nr:cation-translocating P-type ATPase [Chlamydiota bacterium]